MKKFILLFQLFLTYPGVISGFFEEAEKLDCIDIALINFQRECRIPDFRVPCYNGTRFHKSDKSIHQMSFDSLKRVAAKCCDYAVCSLKVIKSEICCNGEECQQLCFGSGPPSHANIYQVKYILDMDMPATIKKAEQSDNN